MRTFASASFMHGKAVRPRGSQPGYEWNLRSAGSVPLSQLAANRAAPDIAVLDQPSRDKVRGVTGDGEANTLGRQNDRGIHANDFARAVEKRSTGVPRIERGIGLNDLIH